jgi:hypothetical protein
MCMGILCMSMHASHASLSASLRFVCIHCTQYMLTHTHKNTCTPTYMHAHIPLLRALQSLFSDSPMHMHMYAHTHMSHLALRALESFISSVGALYSANVRASF